MLLNSGISIVAFLKLIRWEIVAFTSYAILIGVLDHYSFLRVLSIPLGVTAVIGTAVSLLLGFRTAQAYERWWEARIIWGAIVNDSRTLIRQLQQFLAPTDENNQLIHEFSIRQIIWCYALGESLRQVEFSQKVQDYIKTHDINETNIPNAILNKHNLAIAELGLTEFKQVQVDTTLGRINDSMGKCERIKNTVFPQSYSLLVHFLIYVFATMLPFGLDDNYILIEISITAIIPLIFISLEKTAILLQDPFENQPMDTPVTKLAQTIEINLKEMTGIKELPKVEKPESYYIM